MKKIYLLAAAAALFAACSSDKDSLETQQQPAQLEEGAVGFDVYTQRATTRGGWTGSLIAALLKMDFKKAILACFVGVLLATVIVSFLSYGLLARVVA